MIEDLNITFKLLWERKSKLIENIENPEESKTFLSNIFEIYIKIKEYNELIKKQSIGHIDDKIIEKIKNEKNRKWKQ